MAQVLAAVPEAGLDAVLVAVELVLESGAVERGARAERARASEARRPAPNRCTRRLTVKQAPLADTGRYDRLREQDSPEESDHA